MAFKLAVRLKTLYMPGVTLKSRLWHERGSEAGANNHKQDNYSVLIDDSPTDFRMSRRLDLRESFSGSYQWVAPSELFISFVMIMHFKLSVLFHQHYQHCFENNEDM